MGEETVTIPKSEYEELLKCQRWAAALEAAGVDSWDGCEVAHELFEDDE